MNPTIEAVAAAIILGIIVLGAAFLKRRPHKLKGEYFQKRWQELQKLCSDKTTWPLAIVNADKLLDEALKKRRFKGKTMGGRLVSAQRSLSDNDGVWYSHKLRNRLVHEADVKLREADVRNALKGVRQALRDLGAL